MARCEDFPCCGHYDEGNPSNTWCPDENGKFPPIVSYGSRYGDGDDRDDPNYGREEDDYDEEDEATELEASEYNDREFDDVSRLL